MKRMCSTTLILIIKVLQVNKEASSRPALKSEGLKIDKNDGWDKHVRSLAEECLSYLIKVAARLSKVKICELPLLLKFLLGSSAISKSDSAVRTGRAMQNCAHFRLKKRYIIFLL